MRKVMANAELEQRTTFLLEELMRVRRVGFEKSGASCQLCVLLVTCSSGLPTDH